MTKLLRYAMALVASATAMSLTSCSEDDNDTEINVLTAYVSVLKDQDGTVTLLADNDSYLKPQNAYLFSSWLPKVSRAFVSFTMTDGSNLQAQDLEAGKTYVVTLNNSLGLSGEIPTFPYYVDVASAKYKSEGNDTINTQGRRLINLAEVMTPYAANGYITMAPAFAYAAQVPVNFLLYYDSEKDIDIANRTVNLSVYFNNHTDYAEYSTSNIISMALPEEIGYMLQDAGISDDSDVTIKLTALEAYQTTTATLQAKLEDFFR